MQPKKKSIAIPIIYGVCLMVVLYCVIHGAVAYELAENMVSTGRIDKTNLFYTFIDIFSVRITTDPFLFQYGKYTQKWLVYGGGGYLLVILAIENSKKNYIRGKEFGTAKWGTSSDIKDLFASTIEASEIKKAKETRTKLGRWKAKSNAYKKCKKGGKTLLKFRLGELEEQEKIKKLNGNGNKQLYQERKEAIKKEVDESVALAKKQAWLPDQYKADYENRLKEIDESPLFTDADKTKQREIARIEYEEKVQSFFNYAKRVTEIKKRYKNADMLFTKTERISFYNYVLNQNTIVLGGSGSGKSRGFVMPNILQAHSSYIITDPKGEILEKAGYFLSKIKGYKIRVLNLDEKLQSDGYNPFNYVHPEREGYEERVLSLIETLIINTDGGEKKGGNDPFWDKSERLFLQAIFFFVSDGFVKEHRNMGTAMQLIQMLKLEEEDDDKNSDLDIFAEIFAERFGKDHIGYVQFREFRDKTSGKTAKSIVISAVARLAPFRTKAVQRLFSYDNMELDRVGEEKTAIFVVVPPTDNTFNFIAGMLFTQLFQELQYCATQVHKHDGQRLPVPVRFILDEFANTCTIPNFVKILAYARSFGIGITPILQSLEQIKNMYKDEWGVIIDNCNTLLYLGSITHMDTLEYMSKLLGKGTFDKRTTGRNRGRTGSSSENFDVIGRDLMDTAEIRKLPKKDCLFIVGGRNPFYSEKYSYESHPNYRFTSDADKQYSFHYTPQPMPANNSENPHGEEKTTLSPSADAHIEKREIKVDDSPSNQLARVTKGIDTMQPISDDLMEVDDGTTTEAEAVISKTIYELIGEEYEAIKKANLTVSEETKLAIEKIRQNKILIEESLIKTVNRIGRTARTLTIIDDELMNGEDEKRDNEAQQNEDEKMIEYIMESSEEKTQYELEAELAECLDDADEILEGFDENPDIS